ncbi:MAG TPA: hypothetical protein VE173_11545, partial [Longimicrobiales bacterium]|nr:hypothetical protein [Longimicrobiales bacterium]
MTIDEESLQAWVNRLRERSAALAADYPGAGPGRQPVHTVYGGAHLFRANTAAKLGELARRSLDEFAPDPATLADATGIPSDELAGQVYPRVLEKLEEQPVEDFRLDFEDGYGTRPDEEEDGHAVSAARQVAAGMEEGTLPPYVGIRIKALTGEQSRRAFRTLDLFVTALVETAGGLPGGFVVTLPKIQHPEQVLVLDEALSRLESRLGLKR